ncbi:MAG: DUF2178 domain-containing protein [Dehalococcoidia bacterium]|jgi:uncharacterized membrane protein
MSYKAYNVIRIAITAIMAALISWAVVNGNFLIPIPIAIAALVILMLFRKGVKEVVVDERVYSIAEKAAYMAFRIFGIAAAVIGATFVALGQETVPELEPIGFMLTYATCGLMIIYYIAYLIYNRKYSGKSGGKK